MFVQILVSSIMCFLFGFNTSLHLSKYVADVLIMAQITHLLFVTQVPYIASASSFIIACAIVHYPLDKKMIFKQRKCILSFIHGIIIMLGGYLAWKENISKTLIDVIIGFSHAYLLYDNISSYNTIRFTGWTNYKFTMIVHHYITVILSEDVYNIMHPVGSYEYENGHMVLIVFAIIELSNIAHWYSYYILNGNTKVEPSVKVKLIDVYMFAIFRTYVGYHVIFVFATSTFQKIFSAFIVMAGWHWGYSIFKTI